MRFSLAAAVCPAAARKHTVSFTPWQPPRSTPLVACDWNLAPSQRLPARAEGSDAAVDGAARSWEEDAAKDGDEE